MALKISMVDVAYNLLKEKDKGLAFAEIWAFIKKQLEIAEVDASKKISQFYTSLIIDGRFVTLGENVWDLRERSTFDKVHIDMNDVYADDDEEKEIGDEDYQELGLDEKEFEDE